MTGVGLAHALTVLALGGWVAWAVVDAGAGIALLLVLVSALTLTWLGPRSGARAPATRAWDVAGLAVGVGLASLVVVRDLRGLGVLVVLGVMAACAWTALPDGRWRALVPGLLAWLPRAAIAPVTLARPLGRHVAGSGSRTARRAAVPLVRGLVLATLLLTVFGGLFASADPAFASAARRLLFVDIDVWPLVGRILAGSLAAALVTGVTTCGASLGVLVGARRHPEVDVQPAGAEGVGGMQRRRRLGLGEWAIALGALDLLFLAFVLLQLPLLFGGQTFVRSADGVTLAEHARTGFAQLVVVVALVLAVVAAAVRWARRESRSGEIVLRALLGLLLALSVVVLASAAVRLDAYVDAFGQTRLRLAVQTSFWWFTAIFALVVAAGLRRPVALWLPRACVLVTGLALLGHLAAGPDARIAERNVARFAATGQVDLATLRGLSADALPALAALPEPTRSCVLAAHAERLGMSEPRLAGVNLARVRGRSVLQRVARELDPTASGWPWNEDTPCPRATPVPARDSVDQDPGVAPS